MCIRRSLRRKLPVEEAGGTHAYLWTCGGGRLGGVASFAYVLSLLRLCGSSVAAIHTHIAFRAFHSVRAHWANLLSSLVGGAGYLSFFIRE